MYAYEIGVWGTKIGLTTTSKHLFSLLLSYRLQRPILESQARS